MFTGIITAIGHIVSVEERGDLRARIACPWQPDSLEIGESIACSGCCLTVVDKGALETGSPFFTVDISAESVQCTVPGQWQAGRKLNLERAMQLSDRLGGHMVSGHVDGLAAVTRIEAAGDSHKLWLKAPLDLSRFIAAKGSATLDGVSLTVNTVDRNEFSVNIISHTWKETTLGERKPGDSLNLEIDLIARYVAQLLPSPS